MTTLRDQVTEFHVAMGHPTATAPTIPVEDRIRLRARLITEEYFETMRAMFSHVEENCWDEREEKALELVDNGWIEVNLPEMIDGLADLDYVVEGTRLEFGIDGAPIAAEVHRANMAKLGGGKREDGKSRKPEGWKPPDIAGEIEKQRGAK